MTEFIDIPSKIELQQPSKVLCDLLDWTRTFLQEISDGSTDKFAHLFVPRKTKFLPLVLMELNASQTFERALLAVSKLDDQTIADRGLAGTRLHWKMANVNDPAKQFGAAPTAASLYWTLDALDALLESMLDGIPGGSAIIELNKGIENSIDRTQFQSGAPSPDSGKLYLFHGSRSRPRPEARSPYSAAAAPARSTAFMISEAASSGPTQLGSLTHFPFSRSL